MFTVNPWGALAIFIGTAVLSGLLVWVSIAIAHRYEILDQPDGLRKIQSRPIPKLGGVAIAVAFSASALLVLTRGADSLVLTEALGILLPAILAALIGYVDDKRGLSPGVRLALQAVVGLAIAWALHAEVHITGVMALDVVIMVLWVMTLINGVNLLDNSDGLAGATVLVSSLSASAVAGLSGQYLIAALGCALAGTSAGFLMLNWNPARVYMGDSGAYFLGTMLAALTLQLRITTEALPWTLLVPLLLASLPLIDTGYVVISRLRQGIHPFTAGRDHLSHRLQQSGLSVGNSVLTLALFLLATGSAAIAITAVNT